jgi:hypothetical protein
MAFTIRGNSKKKLKRLLLRRRRVRTADFSSVSHLFTEKKKSKKVKKSKVVSEETPEETEATATESEGGRRAVAF